MGGDFKKFGFERIDPTIQSIYQIKCNRYITFGAWAENSGQSLASSYPDDVLPIIGLRSTEGGYKVQPGSLR